MNKKLKQLNRAFRQQGADGLLISTPANISYISGFREIEAYLLLSADKCVLFTTPIYSREAARISLWQVKCRKKNLFQDVAETAKKLKIKNLGYEAKNIPQLEQEHLNLACAEKSIKLVQTVDCVESLRAVKTKPEIQAIRSAVRITEQALEFASEIIEENTTEKQLQIEIEKIMRIKGDNDLAFKPIVAFGKNSSNPHHAATGQNLSSKSLILIDLGAKFNGFCADLTRIFILGKMPIHLKKIYDIVRKAQDCAVKKIRAGVKACEVDQAAREIIENAGYGKFFGHGLGHGVGRCVHEMPFLQSRNQSRLKENMVITVEPAIYLPQRCGIRLESMFIVKKTKGERIDADSNR